MRAVQTLAGQRVAVAIAKDLRLPAISVARPTLYLSSLRLAGPCCVANVSAQVVPHSREPKCFSVELKTGWNNCYNLDAVGQAFLCVLDEWAADREKGDFPFVI